MSLPKFELPQLSFEEFDNVVKSAEGRTKMKPGQYEAVITGVTIGETPAVKDPTWLTAKITLQVGTETVKETVMLPTKSYTYGEKKSGMPFARLKSFLVAVGALSEDTQAAAKEFPSVLEACFSNGAKSLANKNISIKLNHLDDRIAGEGDGEARRYFILKKNGLKLTDPSGAVVYLPTFDAADAYAKSNNIRTYNGLKVEDYQAPAQKNRFSWKKDSKDF